jgi:O-methyltransferase
VDKGNSATVIARVGERLNKITYLFDTFEGFPDCDIEDPKHHGVFSGTSLEFVRDNVSCEAARYIKGYFPDSASRIPTDQSFCLVHLDCDLYKPFAAGLEFFWPRLVPGGFLVMHDYMTMHWAGVEKACDEFFANKKESVVPIPDWGGTVIVRKNKTA